MGLIDVQKFKRETQQMANNAIMDFFIQIDDLMPKTYFWSLVGQPARL